MKKKILLYHQIYSNSSATSIQARLLGAAFSLVILLSEVFSSAPADEGGWQMPVCF